MFLFVQSIVGLYAIAGVCLAVSWILSGTLIYQHLQYYSKPDEQRYNVRILFMIPIYTLYSFLACLFVSLQLYFAILRDSYESYVLYQFYKLCVNLAGGEEELIVKLNDEKMKLIWPLHKREVTLNAKFILWVKRGILQYVVVRPLTSFVALVLELFGKYGENHWSIYGGFMYIGNETFYILLSSHSHILQTAIINNVAFTISLYCLFVFYQATKRELKPNRPLLKFLTIKIVVFFSFWQSIAISLLVAMGAIQGFWLYTSHEAGIVINNFMICVEMVFIR